MPEHDDGFEGRLGARLRAAESRVPDRAPPEIARETPHALRSTILAITAVGAVVLGGVLLQALPTREVANTAPSEVTLPSASPSESATPELPTATPTPAATPAATPTPPGAGWQVLPFPFPKEDLGPLRYDDELEAWMMIPHIIDLDGSDAPPIPVWMSFDGAQWTATGSIPLDAIDEPAGFLRMGRPVRFRGDLYLSATHIDQSNSARPLAWTSTDGITWRPLDTNLPAGEYGSSEVIASNGTVLLADVGERNGSHAWRSTDGQSWREVVLPGGSHPKGVYYAHADRDGFVVAGAVLRDQWVLGMWISSDGIEWTEASSFPVRIGFHRGVFRGPDASYVAAVYFNDAPAQVLTSPDGSSWSSDEIGNADERLAAFDGSRNGLVYLGLQGWTLRVLTMTGEGGWQESAPGPSTEGYSDFFVSVGNGRWVAIGSQAGTDDPSVEPLPPVLLVGELQP